MKKFATTLFALAVVGCMATTAFADGVFQNLPFVQNWSNTGLITVDDNWSGVPGIIGYRGDDMTNVTGTDPQTLLGDGTITIDVNANNANPNTFATGGVAEFDALLDPVVGLQGSGTADAPYLVFHVNTTGLQNILVGYLLRDVDGSADNSTQQVALQYRLGTAGAWTNLPAGYVADASTGPSLATAVFPISVTLPAAANNQPQVQVRVLTTNAVGNDEWIGVDNITIEGSPIPPTDGACCLRNTTAGACIMATPQDCAAQGGIFLGLGVLCDPLPCVTGAKQSSWGAVKSIYR